MLFFLIILQYVVIITTVMLSVILSVTYFLQRIMSILAKVSLMAEVMPFSWSVQIKKKAFKRSIKDKITVFEC